MRLISFYSRTRISDCAARAFLLRDDFSRIFQKIKKREAILSVFGIFVLEINRKTSFKV